MGHSARIFARRNARCNGTSTTYLVVQRGPTVFCACDLVKRIFSSLSTSLFSVFHPSREISIEQCALNGEMPDKDVFSSEFP